MQAGSSHRKANHKDWLYPLLVIAAVLVIILSAIGAATLAGWLPRAETPNVRQAGFRRGKANLLRKIRLRRNPNLSVRFTVGDIATRPKAASIKLTNS